MLDANNLDDYIDFQLECELARRSFFDYCRLFASDFYKEEREYLVELCNTFQQFIESDTEMLVVNMPPRTGKSRTAQFFVQWLLGRDKTQKIMTCTYNATLATQFAKGVRNDIQAVKGDMLIPVYSDVFPDVKIKDGDGAMDLWSLEGGYNNYLAVSPGSSSTGFGCSLLVVDDTVKNAEEAYSDIRKEQIWDWFRNTMLSRMEVGAKIIVVITRWATDDLAGHLMRHYEEIRRKYIHINFKAKDDNGKLLCEDIISEDRFEFLKKTLGADIFNANYQQEPIDLKGCLYTELKTWKELPKDHNGNLLFTSIESYTDTADEGNDYLCSIAYGVYNQCAYILDVIHTQDPMEKTEPATAKMFDDNDVSYARIESNNGGRGFARNVEKLLTKELGNIRCKVNWFYQSGNKKARILSNATVVMNNIFFPPNWKELYPSFYKEVTRYQREGKNAHDDGCDVLTGIAERLQERRKMKINPKALRRR